MLKQAKSKALEDKKGHPMKWSEKSPSQKAEWLKNDKSVAKKERKPLTRKDYAKGDTRTKFMKELDAHKADRRFW